MLSLSSEQRGSFTVVKVSGNLDLTSRDQFDQFLTATRRGSRQLIIDMSEVTFMDTGCLAVIVGHYKRLSVSGSLVLAGARYRPAKTLWITGLAYRLPLYESVEDAIAGGPPTVTQPAVVGEEPPAGEQLPAPS